MLILINKDNAFPRLENVILISMIKSISDDCHYDTSLV